LYSNYFLASCSSGVGSRESDQVLPGGRAASGNIDPFASSTNR